jgi:hypothetical protein
VAREDDVEFVECLDCGEVFDSNEFRDMAIEEMQGEEEETPEPVAPSLLQPPCGWTNDLRVRLADSKNFVRLFPLLPQGADRQCIVAFGQPLAVLIQNQRAMKPARRGPPQRAVQQDLPRR